MKDAWNAYIAIQLCLIVVAISVACSSLRGIERAIRELRVEVRITGEEVAK